MTCSMMMNGADEVNEAGVWTCPITGDLLDVVGDEDRAWWAVESGDLTEDKGCLDGELSPEDHLFGSLETYEDWFQALLEDADHYFQELREQYEFEALMARGIRID